MICSEERILPATLRAKLSNPLAARPSYFLRRDGNVLDERGGPEVIQVLPKNLAFTHGNVLLMA
jgi:hypothetical protein